MITHVDTCRFVSAVGGVIAWRQRDGGSTDPATPDGCEPLVMQTTPVPFGEQWPSGQALFLHNTLNHGSNMIDKGVWFNMMDYLKKKGRIQR